MTIKHATSKTDGQSGFASEWNADHTIEAGTIVDAAVNAAAAIARSKLAAPTVADHPSVPACSAYSGVAQSIASGVWWVYLGLELESFDTDTIHDLVTNNSRLTCKTPGYYLIVGNGGFINTAAGRRSLSLWKNTTQMSQIEGPAVADTNSYPILTSSIILPLAVNDYIRMALAQTSGGAINTLVTGGVPSLSMVWMGP